MDARAGVQGSLVDAMDKLEKPQALPGTQAIGLLNLRLTALAAAPGLMVSTS